MNKKNSPYAGSNQGVKNSFKDIVPLIRGDVNNRFILHAEKQRLVKMLAYGFEYQPEEFANLRHKLLASALSAFMSVYPVNQYTCGDFIIYLQSIDELQRCGGEGIVREIFGGIG